MCQEYAGSPPAIVNRDADGSSQLHFVSPGNSLVHCRRILLLGGAGSGKTSLAKSLVTGSAQTSDGMTESLHVHVWNPFKIPAYENLLGRKVTSSERSLVVDVWDSAGQKVWQSLQHIFLTSGTLPVVVFNLSDQASCDEVLTFVNHLWTKCPCTRVIIIGTHTDKLSQVQVNVDRCQDILSALRNRHARCTRRVQQEINDLRNLPEPRTAKCRERISHLENLLEYFPKPPSEILTCSSQTAQGLDDIRRDILQAILEANRSSCIEYSLPVHSVTAKVYDDILAMRKDGHLVLPSSNLRELFTKHESDLDDVGIQRELAFLETSGILQCFNDHFDEEDRPICINPSELAKAFCLVHMSDTKKSFRFEAKRFWPKSDGGNSRKPNPSILVQALEDIATEGLVRESLFPLLWQDMNMNEKQTRLVIDLMARLGFLNRAANAHGDAEKRCLQLPNFPGLSTKIQHRIPLLGLTPNAGPTLNWTHKPFKGDAQLTWRFTFPLNSPTGLIPRLLAMCRTNTPEALYRHQWKNGLLLKMGQVSVNLQQPDSIQSEKVDMSVRLTVDEEGLHRATEVLWVVLARFLVIADKFLASCPGVYYQVSLIPSNVYYTSEKGLDELEVDLLDAMAASSRNKTVMKIVVQEQECEVNIYHLLPLPGEPMQTISEWLQWMANQEIQLSETTPSIHEPDDLSQSDSNSQSSLQPSPSPPRLSASPPQPSPSPVREEQLHAMTSPPVKANKKLEIKWKLDNGWRKVSEEDEIREVKKVAASFVAAVLAGAVAQLITEQSRTEDQGCTMMEREAKCTATMASARAAQAAQSGQPEAAAMAVVAAAQAMDNAMMVRKKGRSGATMIKSRMCTLM